MFTGIVQTQAEVLQAGLINGVLKLKVKLPLVYIENLQKGASVANNGVCLTAVEFGALDVENAFICFDIIDETLRVTNLKAIELGHFINIERSLKVGDEIGGHMVSGHVHCVGKVSDITKLEDNYQMTFVCDEAQTKYILPKGFITINGTSLTVGKVEHNSFNVHLIPETLEITNLSRLQLNDEVNIELDQQTVTIVDTIERMRLKLA